MRVIGLTGGIASGKSTVARLFSQLGASLIDADQIARQVVAPGESALTELRAAFGEAILLGDGSLDRKRLGAVVFADAAARARLNAITHPRIAAATAKRIAELDAAGVPLVLYEASLLVENGLHRGLDGLIVVACDPAVQRARLMARDNLDRPAAEARIAAQAPLADKLAVATWVIDSSGTFAEVEAQVRATWKELEVLP